MDKKINGSQANADDKMLSRHIEMYKERQRDKSMTERSISGPKY